MDARKAVLNQIASSPSVQAWAAECGPSTFAGTSRVQSRNTTYLFRNGSCFAVTHGDQRRGASTDLVGMKLVGWLLPADATSPRGGEIRVSRNWTKGACAVLWGGRARSKSQPIALTSPTQAFTQFAHGAPVEMRERPPIERALSVTYTRINLPMAAISSVRPLGEGGAMESWAS